MLSLAQSSSVNPFNKAELWAKQFLACARGLNPVDFFNSTTQLPVNIRFDPIAQLKILYPTSQYIEDSISEGVSFCNDLGAFT